MNPAYRKLYRVTKPWYYYYDAAASRCQWKGAAYKKHGIKFLLSVAEIKSLWDRDNAALMKKPSLDRINTTGHYLFENCRFIELDVNKSRQKYQWKDGDRGRGISWDKARQKWKAFLQYKGQNRHLGRFVTRAEAQAAYNREVKMIYGEEALMAT